MIDMRLPHSRRLRFREMTDNDLTNLSTLLGDSGVMRFYDHPKSLDDCQS